MTELHEDRDGAELLAMAFKTAAISTLMPGDHTTGLNLPKDWTPADPPRLVFFGDGGENEWPVRTKERIRLTVWAKDRGTARNYCRRALAVLLGYPLGVGPINDPTAMIYAPDKQNGGYMGSVTVAVSVRTSKVIV